MENALRETVFAFNNNDIVATYDFDMDVWHPNREKMAYCMRNIAFKIPKLKIPE